MGMGYEAKFNEQGRCRRHPTIELACREQNNSDSSGVLWRVLLQDCPLCSFDADSTSGSVGPTNTSQVTTATHSTKTNRTTTTEEESTSVGNKSWTMSDASEDDDDDESDDESRGNASRMSSMPQEMFGNTIHHTKHTGNRAPPPPPPKPANAGGNRHQQQHHQQQQQQHSPDNINNNFDPVQSLKELGRKLVQESENGTVQWLNSPAATTSSSSSSRPTPPPPPPPRTRTSKSNTKNNDYRKKDSISSMSTRELSQLRRSQKMPKQTNKPIIPPKKRQPNTTTTTSNGQLLDNNESNDGILGEASDIIARMESLTEGFLPSSPLSTANTNTTNTTNANNITPLSNNSNSSRDAVREASERLAEEKRVRAQRRQEKAERKAARHRAKELLKQQQQQHQQQQQQQQQSQDATNRNGGETFEMPMNDAPQHRGRALGGGGGGGSNDILQAAAQIRARARRSTSRSRERIKEASYFIGEPTTEDIITTTTNNYESGDDLQSMSSEKRKRSILNPHGLEEMPQQVQMERRSQSRERRKSSSRRRNGSRSRANSHEGVAEDQSARRGGENNSRGKNREPFGLTHVSSSPLNQHQQQYPPPTTAEELLNRRREMRQKIVERQSKQQEMEYHHRRASSGGGGAVGGEDYHQSFATFDTTDGDTATDILSRAESSSGRFGRGRGASSTSRGRDRGGNNVDGGQGSSRRGRSRSAVRDGISKMRSASLKPFKKKIGKGIYSPGIEVEQNDTHTEIEHSISVDSEGKRSTASSTFKRMLSKGNLKPRSLSRGRSSSRSYCDGTIGDTRDTAFAGGWAAKSDPFVGNETTYEQYGDQFESRSVSAKSAMSAATSSSSKFGRLKRSLSKKRGGRGLVPGGGEGKGNNIDEAAGGGVVRSLSRGSFRRGSFRSSPGTPFGGDDIGEKNSSKEYWERWDARSEGRPDGFGFNDEFDGF